MGPARAAARVSGRHGRRSLIAALGAALLWPGSAPGAPELVPLGDFDQPVHVTGAPGDPARVYVVEKEGLVQLLVDGVRAGVPFADFTDITDARGERGLLSIAFPSDHAASGRFYVFLTATAAAAPSGDAGDILVLEGRRSADPDVADADHRRRLLSIPHPADNHNGGQLAFGPDGALYASVGDGGSQGDPEEDAQDPTSPLGKLLRVDTASGAYTIWALGLRNPWRFSFDRVTGDTLIGDVGGGLEEEVDFAPAGSGPGRNYGWNDCEGDEPAPCPLAGAVPPALSLAHTDGYSGVIGGFVVRDPGLPTLQGRYLFGDLAQGTLLSAVVGAGGGSDLRAEPDLPVGGLASLGEDACGHVHVAALGGGVWRIQDGAPGACVPITWPPPPQQPPPAPPPGPGVEPDRRPCAVALRYARRQRGGRITLRLRADEACRATLRARGFRRRSVELAAGVERRVRLSARRRVERRLAAGRSVRRTVRISAVDAAGNRTLLRPRVRLRTPGRR